MSFDQVLLWIIWPAGVAIALGAAGMIYACWLSRRYDRQCCKPPVK